MKKGRKVERHCLCDLCVRIFPMHARIKRALPTAALKKDFEYLMMRMMVAEEDQAVANAKIHGEWPGWEWMKTEYAKRGCSESLALPLRISPKPMKQSTKRKKTHALTLALINQHQHLTTVIETAVESLCQIAKLPPRNSTRARKIAESTIAFLQTQSDFVAGSHCMITYRLTPKAKEVTKTYMWVPSK